MLVTGNAAEPKPDQEIAPGVRLISRISDVRIAESSGVVASRRYANVFWTHNDGGGPKKQVLYAIDREGNTHAAFPVTGPTFHDWEDIAIDDAGHLYLGDIGNNDSKADALAVYEIDEPDPASSVSFVSPKRGWKLKFPAAPFDCESLFIWKDYGYVISKVFDNERAQVFRFLSKTRTGRSHSNSLRQRKLNRQSRARTFPPTGSYLASCRRPVPTFFGSTATWRALATSSHTTRS